MLGRMDWRAKAAVRGVLGAVLVLIGVASAAVSIMSIGGAVYAPIGVFVALTGLAVLASAWNQ